MLCPRCTDLNFAVLVAGLKKEEEIQLQHHPTWASLSHAAQSGCKLCLLFLHALIQAYAEQYEWTRAEIEQHHERRDVENETVFMVTSAVEGWGFWYDRLHIDLGPDDYIAKRFPDGLALRPFVRVCAGQGELGLRSRVVQLEADFELCETWLAECSTEHANCSGLGEQDLPTRLVDVGPADGSGEPRLALTAGQRGKYVTLSHCWGDSKPPVTDAVSFATYLECIPFQTLPRTFKDAVSIVRKLGFRYLWIDCFCIIQGDERDWQIECAKMHSTFENCSLTIAGPGAGNTNAGILLPRREPVVPTCEIPVKASDGSVAGTVILMVSDLEVCANYGQPRPEQHAPLSTRAWIVQERCLSPRILYFGKSQLYMECRSATRFECSNMPQNSAMGGERYSRAHLIIGTGVEQDLDIWHEIVRSYSFRYLTESRDILPALSGLASRVQKTIDDVYLAGIWQSALLRGLHWGVYDEGHEDEAKRRQKPASYTAPSWSWASCHYGLRWQLNQVTSQQAFQLHRIHTTVAGLDPFGEVSAGTMTLTGKIKSTLARRRPASLPANYWGQNPGKEPTTFYACVSATEDRDIAGFLPDRLDENSASESYQRHIYCLLLASHVDSSEPNSAFAPALQEYWTALALEPVGGAVGSPGSVFRRVGLLISNDLAETHPLLLQISKKGADEDNGKKMVVKHWFDDACERQIELV